MEKYNFILASASPRRCELLSIYIKDFKVAPVNIKESIPQNIDLENAPLYLAQKKFSAFSTNISDNDLVITADTIVLLDNKIYGKPKDKNDAFHIIKNLSNKTHKVITGVCCKSGDRKINIKFIDITKVTFAKIPDNTIEKYINYADYMDKAGAYAIQDIASMFVEKIDGSYDNVVGLPIGRLIRELIDCGIDFYDYMETEQKLNG